MVLDEIKVGDVVNVPGDLYGTVRFVGAVAGKPGRFAGVELAPEYAGRGKNSGDVDGRSYFKTAQPGSGIFVPVTNPKYISLRKASNASSAASAPAPGPARSSVGPRGLRVSSGLGLSMAPSSSSSHLASSSPPSHSPLEANPRIRQPSFTARTGSPGPSAAPKPAMKNNFRSASLAPPASAPMIKPGRLGSRSSSRYSDESAQPSPELSGSASAENDRSATPAAADNADLVERIQSLERLLSERDQQLEEHNVALAELQDSINELEGMDAMQVRAQLREKNEKINILNAEFDNHRADFRSTLDALETAASETERVYEKKLEDLLQSNRELQDRGEDVESVARQLKQLEELVSELEEGLEDARRGEAEARGEVEFLRGEVERTKLELQQEREKSAIAIRRAKEDVARSLGKDTDAVDELDQKDEEINQLKGLVETLQLQNENGTMAGIDTTTKPDEQTFLLLGLRIDELENVVETRGRRIDDLEQQLKRARASGGDPAAETAKKDPHQSPESESNDRASPDSNVQVQSPAVVLEEPQRTPSPPPDAPEQQNDPRAGTYCSLCESDKHDILNCPGTFEHGEKGGPRSDAAMVPQRSGMQTPASVDNPIMTPSASDDDQKRDNHPRKADIGAGPVAPETPTTPAAFAKDAAPMADSPFAAANGLNHSPVPSGRSSPAVYSSNKLINRNAIIMGPPVSGGGGGVNLGAPIPLGGPPSVASGGASSIMKPIAGKASGQVDESKWCAMCERDGHESIDCPFDID